RFDRLKRFYGVAPSGRADECVNAPRPPNVGRGPVEPKHSVRSSKRSPTQPPGVAGDAPVNRRETRSEDAQARSLLASGRPPELKRGKRQLQIGAKELEPHGVPRLVESDELFGSHEMKFSMIARRWRRSGERHVHQANRHYLWRCHGEFERL